MTKIKTKELQKIVSQLSTVQPNKLLEITRYWHIEGDEEGTMFTAYDGSNFVRVLSEVKGDIDVIVKAEQFGKLVDKTTVEHIVLTQTGENLKVIANGEYHVDIVQEDEEYPSYESYIEKLPKPEVVSSKVFSQILNINESAVSKSGADGIYTGYLLQPGKAITTDAIRVCINPTTSLSTSVLMSPTLMNIFSNIDSDKIKVYILPDESIYAESSTVKVYGKLLEGIADYVDTEQITAMTYTGSVALPTQNIQSILERLTLFMNAFDRGTVVANFTADYLELTTTTGSFERIKYFKPTDEKQTPIEAFKCVLNSVLLRDILTTVTKEFFTLSYGNDSLIKIEANEVEYYLALSEDE